MKNFKYGLKLWSTNENYLEEAKMLYKKCIYSYIELYIIPGSYEKYLNIWKDFKVPYVIHAPHYKDKLNLAKKENKENNLKLYLETKKFADELAAGTIIFHPGISGDIKETVNQLKILRDKRIAIENKPYNTVLNDGQVCNGHSVKEIKYVIDNAETGFCLDIGHAFCAAISLKKDPYEYLNEFLKLKPVMFHLTDGDINSPIDKHKHIGNGSYDFKKLLKVLPNQAFITVETEKISNDNLLDFNNDIDKLISHSREL